MSTYHELLDKRRPLEDSLDDVERPTMLYHIAIA